MKVIQRILHDLKRGENIDLYLTVAVALLVALLNLFGFAVQEWITSLNLAVLAIIAFAMLGNRHRLGEIRYQLDHLNKSSIVTDFPEDMKDDLDRASEIWIFGVNANKALRFNRELLKKKLYEGKTVKVLLVNPNGNACAMAAARVPGRLSVERERANIVANLEDFCDLKQHSPKNIEIRTVDDPLFYGGFMLDSDTTNGVIYLQRYSYQTGVKPKFVYRSSDKEWYEFIKTELHSLWKRSEEWMCNP